MHISIRSLTSGEADHVTQTVKIRNDGGKLLDHISRLEPLLLDFVEVRHPQTTSSLLQLIDKYEEKFPNRMTRGPISETQLIARIINSQTGVGRRIGGIPEFTTDTMTPADSRGNPTDLEVKMLVIIAGSIVDAEVINLIIDSIIPAVDKVVRGTVRLGVRMAKQVFKLLSDRCESGRDRSQNTANPFETEQRTIRISSLRMTHVDFPYVHIILNETFITALWDTGAEKAFISEETYRRYFSYRPRQRTKDRVVTAQGAPCCPLGRVELLIRIRDFKKTW
ncbi:uncharacterized protein TNCV_4931431 [Trichonephila clavipes]|nr:uncharacterized protein TNCV_4931431 [Trichonephila clavipes]